MGILIKNIGPHGPEPCAGARRRGAKRPEFLVYYKSVQKNIACHVFECCIKTHISDARDMLLLNCTGTGSSNTTFSWNFHTI